jgi:hypothetical protein
MSDTKSNSEFIKELMDNNPHGVIGDLVVIEALSFYLKMASDSPMVDNGRNLINPVAWNDSVDYFKKGLAARYGKIKDSNDGTSIQV